MRILIVGGTGLISTAIARCLARRGDDVTLYPFYDRIIASSTCHKGRGRAGRSHPDAAPGEAWRNLKDQGVWRCR